MFCMLKKKNNISYFVSKHNLNHEKQVILLMISNGEKLCKAKSKGQWRYLTVKKTIGIIKRNNF